MADRLARLVVAAAALITVDRVRRLARFAAAEHRLPHARASSVGESRSVTAVVPMRDEERHAQRCVKALLASGDALREVVVVDDGSSDATRSELTRIADPRLRVLDATAPRPGECGKPAACAHGSAQARGDWLWFVDADVVVAPDLLSRLLAAADERDADLVSAVGRLTRAGGATGWLLPAVGFAVARRHDPARVADATCSDVFAAGHCLLVRRDVYDSAGGHAAVAAEVVDDVALAQSVKRRGGRVLLVTAFDGFDVAMYDGTRSMWRGLLRTTSAVGRPGTAGFVLDVTAALVQLAPATAVACVRSRTVRRVAGAVLSAQVVVDAGARAVARQSVRPALLTPLADSVIVAMRLQAMVRRRRGGTVGWRGRPVVPD
ncbi:MAG TPA: glycosyltransferase family 2 protein [Mycobacteriales bacterium]|nr:glycosyltransferase family 2 protein [Mycobacteriales bacterium]